MPDIPDQLCSAFADRYPMDRELGHGGMATVYLARDVKHRRPIALKILHQEYARDIGVNRFLREIEITAKLTHPNILPLYDSGETEGFLYYVMPYVEGESLRHRLDRESPLPVAEAVRIARQVADALSYAHRQGIIHRDIKPENILLEDGQAVVADFGIAWAVSAAGGEALTASGLIIGTPQYMSPEQGSGEHDIDARSDLYALGCVLYEMLTGEPPFMGRTARSVIVKHMSEAAPSVRAVRPDVPEWLEAVVHTALAKMAADRFPTAEAFSEALAGGPAPRTLLGHVLGSGRRRLMTAALIAAALVAGFFAVRNIDRGPGPEPPALTAGARLNPARIAVLYFEDESADQGLGPLCAAFTRKMIHELSGVADLDIISYNGIKPYRRSDVTPDSLARALGVGTIVDASVATSGSQLRVLAQLIDATTARVIASKEIERPRGETFALLDDVAREVGEFLRRRLGVEIRLKERLAETESVEAWNLVQQAELLRDEYMPLVRAGEATSAASMLQHADRLLTRAEALDPGWSDPSVLRGWVAWEMGGLRSNVPGKRQEVWIRRGLEHAEAALEKEPGDPAALELRGTLRLGLFRQTPDSARAADLLADAERDLRAAVEADPSLAGAWNTLSTLLHEVKGDFIGAKAAAVRAYEEDEFLEEAKGIITRLANLSLELGEYEEAIRWTGEGRRRFPDVVNFAGLELLTLTMDGPEPDVQTAWELLERVRELSPPHLRSGNVALAKIQVAAVLARAGKADSAIAVIERTRSTASDEVLALIAYYEAHAWLLLGDRASALEALTLHLENDPNDKAYIASDPWFAELRGDPRFKALVGI